MEHLPFPKMLYKGGKPSGKDGDFREVSNADELEDARKQGFEEYDAEEKSRSPEEKQRIADDEARRERDRLKAEGAEEIERQAREEKRDQVDADAAAGRTLAAEESSADTKKLDAESKASATQVDHAGNVKPGDTGLEPAGGHPDAPKASDAPDSKTGVVSRKLGAKGDDKGDKGNDKAGGKADEKRKD